MALKPYAKNLQTGEVRQVLELHYDANGVVTRVIVSNNIWKDVRYTFAQNIEQAKELLQ